VQALDGQLVLSATDVVDFAVCGHRTALDREVALGLRPKPVRDNPMGALLTRMGMGHEADELAAITASGVTVVLINPPGPGVAGLIQAQAETRAAMAAGAGVVYQATFYDAPWRGQADFLFRAEVPSALGSWSYEVGDAKLHRTPKQRDWLQLAFYSDHVGRLQGRIPEQAHIMLGGGARSSGPIGDHLVKVRQLQGELLAAITNLADPAPEPNSSCTFCRWKPDCEARWRAEGHLSLLGVDRRLRPKLEAAGAGSVSSLAALGPGSEVEGVAPDQLRKFRSDARLYLQEQRTGVGHLRLRYPRDGQGLALLPAPADGDVFFDLEGYPFGPDGQIEYLWGLVVRSAGVDTYHRWWAHIPAEEAAAFAATVAFIESAVAGDPDRRVYHYNHYETGVFRRLAARVGGDLAGRAAGLVDTVFVDLLPIARTSVRTSSMSSGLKALERFYRNGREGNVTDATGSMIDYAAWLDTGDVDHLRAIEDYNRADCESLADLRAWLLGLAADVAEARADSGEPDARILDAAAIPDLRERIAALAALPGAGPLLRRALVALDFDCDFDVDETARLIGVTAAEAGAALIRGKKELGIPLSAEELRRP